MVINVEESSFDSRLSIFIYQLSVYELPAKKIGDLIRSISEDPALAYADPYHVAYANELAAVLTEDLIPDTAPSSDG